MNLRPVLNLDADRGTVTSRQIEVLEAVSETGSINTAAQALGIRPPVVFRHIRNAESATGAPLVTASSRGSALTIQGEELLDVARSLQYRVQKKDGLVVACSPVTEELLMTAIPKVDPSLELVVSHDRHNLRQLRQGILDMAVIDDPLMLMDVEGLNIEELGFMDMVHIDRGPRYVRHRYGAQRIGFRHLESLGRPFNVEEELLSVNDLLESGRSFFVDEILLLRKGLRLRSSTDPHLLRHSVIAVHGTVDPRIDSLIRMLRERMGN